MDVRVPIAEVNQVIGAQFSDRRCILGGLVTTGLRRIPTVGAKVIDGGFQKIDEKVTERVALRFRFIPF